MYDILEKRIWYKKELAIKEFLVDAPEIAKAHRAGQFVIIIVDEKGERIPLTIADSDPDRGTINLVFQEVGKTTLQLGSLNKGDSILHIAGPLGKPTHIERFGTVVCVGGGIGIAPLHPIAKAMKLAGNKVLSILGSRSKELLIYEGKMRKTSDDLRVTTDDGSYGRHGVVTDELRTMIDEDKISIDLVVVIGPPMMMKFVCELTKFYGIKTYASLNPIMVDGSGMCGACRVTVGGKTRFACVDGPEFDGHQVDFDEMILRQRQYLKEEKIALEEYKKHLRDG
ncbi:MAG: sulfide/dihydroorotate dehydrogenase-like FAD/NAD-binding protein [Nitrospirae bacterium]|nr:MAG: sulfide/dihydroorotate dehydrogenase-like FAD/NAD-binding protein [Nitrospirota bacterium]